MTTQDQHNYSKSTFNARLDARLRVFGEYLKDHPHTKELLTMMKAELTSAYNQGKEDLFSSVSSSLQTANNGLHINPLD